jgi:hypothetical protein
MKLGSFACPVPPFLMASSYSTENISAVLKLYSINLKVILNIFYFATDSLYVVQNSVGDVSGIVMF